MIGRLAWAGALLCCVLLTLSSSTVFASVRAPATGERIYFHSNQSGAFNIWSMNPDGTGATQLTTSGDNAVAAERPSATSDGSKVAFMEFDDVVHVNSTQIWIMNGDGSGQTQLTNTGNNVFNWEPGISPDGSKIAFMRFDQSGSTGFDIWTMNADGSSQTVIADTTDDEKSPEYSPDASKIVYVRATGSNQIWLMNADGSNPHVLLDNPGAQDTGPSFSPDGSKIAYADNGNLFVMNADGSNPTQILDGEGNAIPAANPTWSRDGTMIGFGGYPGAGFGIYVVPAAGGADPVPLKTGHQEDFPSWTGSGAPPPPPPPPPPLRPTTTSVSCVPPSVPVGTATTCGATVTDTGTGTPVTPTGSVSFTTNSRGSFDRTSCTLARLNAASAGCTVQYTPTAVDSGTHLITATYPGDGAHTGSLGRTTVGVRQGPPAPPANTSPPSIVQQRSCQFFIGRVICQPIPHQYFCRSGTWTGYDPSIPFQYEWDELYHRSPTDPTLVWREEGTGASHYARQFQEPPYVPTSLFRCIVTATGAGGSTSALSATMRLDTITGLLRIPPPAPVNIIVTGIEVTQSVQSSGCAGCVGTLPSRDQSNSNTPGQATYQGVNLAQGNFTTVRVFASALTGVLAGATAQLEVLNASGRRIALLNANSSPATLDTPACWFCVRDQERAKPGASFNFLVPWQDTYDSSLTFRATVSPKVGPLLPSQCSGCNGNVFTFSSVPFVPVATIPIHPIPLTLGTASNCGLPSASGCTSLTPQQVFNDAETLMPFHFQVYPYEGPLVVDGTQSACTAAGVVSNRGAADGYGPNDYEIGVFTSGMGSIQNGCTLGGYSLFNNGAASAVLDSSRSISSVTHEMGHGLGLAHASTECGGGQDGDADDNGQTGVSWPPDNLGYLNSAGFDRRSWDIYETGSLPSTYMQDYGHDGSPSPGTKYYDFMSYCPGGDGGGNGADNTNHWMSLVNWNYLVAYHPPGRPQAPRTVQGTPLRVLAMVQPGGSTSVLSVTPGQSTLGPPTADTPYRVELRDASGQVLSSVVPVAGRAHVDFAQQPPDVLLDATLPLTADTASVAVTYAGQDVASKARSAHAPTVTFVTPRRGARVGRGRTTLVRWSAHDADNDPLTSTVEYSADGGRQWKAVAGGLKGNSARIASRLLSASSNARLRVLVSDGFDLATATSGRLRAAGSPPTVQILHAPRRGRVLAGASLLLEGSAFDDADRPLKGRRLKWYLGKRLVGTGPQATVPSLQPVTTTIRLVATDSHGRSAQATLPLRVSAGKPRFLLFDAPLLVPPKKGSVRMRIASSTPATFTIAGKHYAVGPRARTLTVRVPRGKKPIVLRISLRSSGGVLRGTYVAVRD